MCSVRLSSGDGFALPSEVGTLLEIGSQAEYAGSVPVIVSHLPAAMGRFAGSLGAPVAAEILDYKWRVVYTTSEDALGLGLDPAEMHHHYGLSLVIRPEHRPDWVTDRHPRQPK